MVRQLGKGKDWLIPKAHLDRSMLLGESQVNILKVWLKLAGKEPKWLTLLQKIPNSDLVEADILLCQLLQAGWCDLERKAGSGYRMNSYEPYKLIWRDKESLKTLFGWSNTDALVASRLAWQAWNPKHEILREIAQVYNYAVVKPDLALRRLVLLKGLDEWLISECWGSERQFSQRVLKKTKAFSKSDKDWLIGLGVDLEVCGISPDMPSFRFSAPVDCYSQGMVCISASMLRYGNSMPIDAFLHIESINGDIDEVLVVENKNVFQVLARQVRDKNKKSLVVWIPGQPHSRWIRAFSHLLGLCAAPVKVACDLDPSGVEIALTLGRVLDKHSRSWQSWYMQVSDEVLAQDEWKLDAYDRRKIQTLRNHVLPVALANLVEQMDRIGFKLEQEILFMDFANT
ncbi:DUF2399 domain-containing protein [Vogesella indigofera]|uniref:DUF2399 domain-containing protein n=1 Tax=Vogesella indigofera TaxID=45465 RepID=UPI00234E81C9|nr:DUF2399 domain-containing protein [Vogesella indigofera]MDC7706396.1 DUF2399 domain-containing protein [Vogesella indigofera]